MENQNNVYIHSRNNMNNINQVEPPSNNPQLASKDELKIKEVVYSKTVNSTQMAVFDMNNLSNLNIKQLNFLQTLSNYSKVKILCNKESCVGGCSSARSHQVIGINDQGEENPLMTASQEELKCNSTGYMLVYRMNNVIFGTLGYQINPFNDCCSCGCELCKCDCICSCCKCEKTQCCCGCCSCCDDCCKNGGCCLGGCCIEQGCCCFCENEGCCIGGFCTFCNCYCFEGGCCKEPCCKFGLCPCPNYQQILLDVRFLNTIQEALTKEAGLYVSTLFTPFDCCGVIPQNIGYKKCGEKFFLDNKCLACGDIELNIVDLEKNEVGGNAKQNKKCFSGVHSYDVDFPKNATPLEKLLIISEIFMFVCLKWDVTSKNSLILTRKRLFLPGLNSDFN